MTIATQIIERLAPGGRLRASINVGNAVLARRETPSGPPSGVSVDIARAFAERLGVKVDFIVFDSAAQSVDAVAEGKADIGFFAVDPKRGENIAFTEPYLLIEGWYLVPEKSPIVRNDGVDRPGRRVVVGKGSAYDLFLSRALTQAEIVRAPNPQAVVPLFLEHELEVAAGVKQQLEVDMARYPRLRLLPERFMVIRQAMGLARGRGEAAHALLSDFVEEIKASGFVQQALMRHGIEGATVAPSHQI